MAQVPVQQPRERINIVLQPPANLGCESGAHARWRGRRTVPAQERLASGQELPRGPGRLAMRSGGHTRPELLAGKDGTRHRWALQEALQPANLEAVTLAMPLSLRQRSRGKAEKVEQLRVSPRGIIPEIVEDDDMTALAADDPEEATDMLPELRDLVVEQLARIDAGARDVAALPPLLDPAPGLFEVLDRFVALVEQPLVERRDQLQRIAGGDDELRIGPKAEDRAHVLRRVKVRYRAFRNDLRRGIDLGKIAGEIMAGDEIAQLLVAHPVELDP